VQRDLPGHRFRIFEGRKLAAPVFAGAVRALIFLVISLPAVRREQKPVLVALLLIAGPFLTHVALHGLLPALAVMLVRVRRATVWRELGAWALATGGSAAMIIGLLFTDLKAFSTVLRADKELMGSVQPLAPLAGTLRYARMRFKSTQIVVEPTGTDARKGPYLAAVEKPVLRVIVAGETGRAASWSLGGYGRETSPELAARDVLLAALPGRPRTGPARLPHAGTDRLHGQGDRQRLRPHHRRYRSFPGKPHRPS
jgi:lipid A ethanolaminephosphotransferase